MQPRVFRIAAGILIMALLWFAWPLWSGYQVRQAMRDRDTAALEARVDFPLLRANLKPKLLAAVREDAQQSSGLTGIMKRALGEAVTERGIDYLVSPGNVARLLAGREFLTRQFGGPAPSTAPPRPSGGDGNDPAYDDPEDADDPMPTRRLRYAFFEGSPTRFRFESVHPRFDGQRIVAHLALQGFRWRLVDISLTPGR